MLTLCVGIGRSLGQMEQSWEGKMISVCVSRRETRRGLKSEGKRRAEKAKCGCVRSDRSLRDLCLREKKKKRVEMRGIDPRAPRMRSECSTI